MWRASLIALGACSFTGQGENVPGKSDAPDDKVKHDASNTLPDPTDAPPGCTHNVDHDSTCDDMDEWWCGDRPTQPDQITTITGMTGDYFHSYVLAYDVAIAPGAPKAVQPNVNSAPTNTLTLKYNWRIKCPNQGGGGGFPGGGGGGGGGDPQQCDVNLVAYLDSKNLGCMVSKRVTDNNMSNDQSISFDFAGPTTPGIYDLRVRVDYDNNCPTEDSQSNSGTIAKLCVAESGL